MHARKTFCLQDSDACRNPLTAWFPCVISWQDLLKSYSPQVTPGSVKTSQTMLDLKLLEVHAVPAAACSGPHAAGADMVLTLQSMHQAQQWTLVHSSTKQRLQIMSCLNWPPECWPYLNLSFKLILALFAGIQFGVQALQRVCLVLSQILLDGLVAVVQLVGKIVHVS